MLKEHTPTMFGNAVKLELFLTSDEDEQWWDYKLTCPNGEVKDLSLVTYSWIFGDDTRDVSVEQALKELCEFALHPSSKLTPADFTISSDRKSALWEGRTRNYVSPERLAANGLAPIFSSSKKWTITCGECGHIWDAKIPFQRSASSVCPCCKTQNRWDVRKWFAFYEKYLEYAC